MRQQFVVEQAVAVMGGQSVDVGLVRMHQAQRRLKVFARQREAMIAVVRSADDDEQRGGGTFKNFLEGPSVAASAACVVDVRNEYSAETLDRAGAVRDGRDHRQR